MDKFLEEYKLPNGHIKNKKSNTYITRSWINFKTSHKGTQGWVY